MEKWEKQNSAWKNDVQLAATAAANIKVGNRKEPARSTSPIQCNIYALSTRNYYATTAAAASQEIIDARIAHTQRGHLPSTIDLALVPFQQLKRRQHAMNAINIWRAISSSSSSCSCSCNSFGCCNSNSSNYSSTNSKTLHDDFAIGMIIWLWWVLLLLHRKILWHNQNILMLIYCFIKV